MKWLLPIVLLLSSLAGAQTTCVSNNGVPCPEWLHKLVGQYPPAPEPASATRAASFFTFNTDSHATLKPDKKSWAMFIGAHAALGLTYAIDRHRTHGVRETASSEVPAILGVTGIDFLAFKCISPSFSIEAPIYGTIHYARDINK